VFYLFLSVKETFDFLFVFLFGSTLFFRLGYALLGMISFGDVSDQFANITETLRTLFSVVNGDIIFDTFRAIDFAGFGGQAYIYFYVLIFTYGKQNGSSFLFVLTLSLNFPLLFN
jgi:hypothetical protein